MLRLCPKLPKLLSYRQLIKVNKLIKIRFIVSTESSGDLHQTINNVIQSFEEPLTHYGEEIKKREIKNDFDRLQEFLQYDVTTLLDKHEEQTKSSNITLNDQFDYDALLKIKPPDEKQMIKLDNIVHDQGYKQRYYSGKPLLGFNPEDPNKFGETNEEQYMDIPDVDRVDRYRNRPRFDGRAPSSDDYETHIYRRTRRGKNLTKLSSDSDTDKSGCELIKIIKGKPKFSRIPSKTFYQNKIKKQHLKTEFDKSMYQTFCDGQEQPKMKIPYIEHLTKMQVSDALLFKRLFQKLPPTRRLEAIYERKCGITRFFNRLILDPVPELTHQGGYLSPMTQFRSWPRMAPRKKIPGLCYEKWDTQRLFESVDVVVEDRIIPDVIPPHFDISKRYDDFAYLESTHKTFLYSILPKDKAKSKDSQQKTKSNKMTFNNTFNTDKIAVHERKEEIKVKKEQDKHKYDNETFNYRYNRVCKPEDRGGEFADGIPDNENIRDKFIEIKPGRYIRTTDKEKYEKGKAEEYMYQDGKFTFYQKDRFTQEKRSGSSYKKIKILSLLYQQLYNLETLGDDPIVQRNRHYIESEFLLSCKRDNMYYKDWTFDPNSLKNFDQTEPEKVEGLPKSRLWKLLGPEFINLAKLYYDNILYHNDYFSDEDNLLEELSYKDWRNISEANADEISKNPRLANKISHDFNGLKKNSKLFNNNNTKNGTDDLLSYIKGPNVEYTKSLDYLSQESPRYDNAHIHKQYHENYTNEQKIKLIQLKKKFNKDVTLPEREIVFPKSIHSNEIYKTLNDSNITMMNPYPFMRNIDFERFFNLSSETRGSIPNNSSPSIKDQNYPKISKVQQANQSDNSLSEEEPLNDQSTGTEQLHLTKLYFDKSQPTKISFNKSRQPKGKREENKVISQEINDIFIKSSNLGPDEEDLYLTEGSAKKFYNNSTDSIIDAISNPKIISGSTPNPNVLSQNHDNNHTKIDGTSSTSDHLPNVSQNDSKSTDSNKENSSGLDYNENIGNTSTNDGNLQIDEKIELNFGSVPENPLFSPLWQKRKTQSTMIKELLIKQSRSEETITSFVSFILSRKNVQHTTPDGRISSPVVLAVAGNFHGCVGFGYGKGTANDSHAEVVNKAVLLAKRNYIAVDLFEDRTLYHSVYGKFNGSIVSIRPAAPGTGIVANNTLWSVLYSCGIKDCVAKNIGSKNLSSIIMATFNALEKHESIWDIAAKTGMQILDLKAYKMVNRRRISKRDYYGRRYA